MLLGLPNWALAALGATMVASLLLTRIVIAVARKRKWLAQPRFDRWHERPTALYGGVAIFAAFALGAAAMARWPGYHDPYDILGLMVGGLTIFLVGLRDDIKPLNPLVKMAGQVLAITPFLVGGLLTYKAPAVTDFIIGLPVTVFWMLALTNAFNLLDNMDGLSAGTGAIIGLSLAACAYFGTPPAPLAGMLSAVMAAACMGFLWFNFRPGRSAQIFMGDCGSMFVGYMLAGLTIVGVFRCAPDRMTAAALPLLIMALPIFDTTLVIIMRRREGRAISQGGRDHTSHRLVYAGLNEKQAVLVLYAVSALVGATAALLMAVPNPKIAAVVLGCSTVVMTLFGGYVSRYSGQRAKEAEGSHREANESGDRGPHDPHSSGRDVTLEPHPL